MEPYMTAVNHYLLPVPMAQLRRIDRSSSPAHKGKLRNAIDFIVPEDTPVLAAADGIVTYVKDDSDLGGPNVIYWNYTNFIVVTHKNGEYSRYDHLAYRSSKVHVGQHVSASQELARVGMTGYTFMPHLHFQVFVFTGINIWTDFTTVKVRNFIG
jgi:murein DD-endopeptidase MepM/ murein hydrolase activator NlpD